MDGASALPNVEEEVTFLELRLLAIVKEEAAEAATEVIQTNTVLDPEEVRERQWVDCRIEFRAEIPAEVPVARQAVPWNVNVAFPKSKASTFARANVVTTDARVF